MSPPKKKTKLVANRIPTVTVLCNELGFGTETKAMSELTNTTQYWRKQYKTPGGKAGRDLTEWKDDQDQEDLKLMTRDYLKGGGFGSRLWPTTAPLPGGLKTTLEYPADKERIADLLCQLFWRQNVYTHRNAQFGRNRSKRSRNDESTDRDSTATSPTFAKSHSPFSTVSWASSLPQNHRSVSGIHLTAEAPSQAEEPYLSHFGHSELPDPSETTRSTGGTGAPNEYRYGPSSKAPAHAVGQTTSFILRTDSGSWLKGSDINDFDPNKQPLPRHPTMGAAPPILQGQVNHKFDTGIHSLQLSELEREQRRAPRVVDDPPPSYDSTTAQRDTTSSHVEEMTRTSSRDSCASKKRRSRHNSGDITGSSAGRGLEPPSTPRRASKRKRTTRDRPGLVPVDVDLDAILNECDDPIARECTHRNHASASISRPIKSASAATPYSFEAPAMSFINLESDTETSTGAPGTTGVRREEETADTDLKTAVHQNISETRYHPAKTLDSSESDKPPASSKPMVGVRFWIIKARLPRFVSEKWVDGKLQGKSLDSVLEGVSNISGSTRIKELRFTLETADSERTYTIANDAEDEFEEMKQQFSTDMRAAFRKNRNEFKDFEIMIEPIDGEDLAKDGEAEVEDAVMGDW